MQQESNKNLVDSTMKEQELKCIICFSTFELDDSYTKWPCKSETPHIYHSDCMLEWLRRKNTCPICRHPVETSNDTFAQFMTQLVF
jgi:E3 ubiquitin-protein ligase DOA10